MLSRIPQWVAVYTRSRAEKRVVKYLSEKGYESYLPLVERRHKWSDRYKMVEEPLFRSYVFVKIKITDVVPVRETAGVCFIVSFAGDIVTIPDNQIDAVRNMVASKQELAVRESNALKKGARVKIVDGAFAGMEGVLVSKCKEGNFAVQIDAIGLSLITSIDRLLLKPVNGK